MSETALAADRPLWTPLLTVQACLASACVVGLFTLTAMLFFIEIPEKNQQTVSTLLGGFVTIGFASIIGFFFGQAQSDATRRASVQVPLPATVTSDAGAGR